MKLRFFLFFILITSFISSCNFLSSDNKKIEHVGEQNSGYNNEIEKWSKAIEKDPQNAELYYNRGMVYKAMQKDTLAIMDFQKSTQLDSTVAKYFSAVGDLMFEHKDVSGSVVWFEKALALNPNDEKAHLKMAKLFLFIEEYPKAFIEINTVLRVNVYNAEAYFLKGMCYKSMQDTNRAISSFQTAVQNDPKYVDAYMQLGLIYQAKNDKLSLKYFENAFKSDTSNLEPVYAQAMFWQNQNQFEEAKNVYRRMVTINRAYPKSYYNMGWVLMQQDSMEKAIRQFTIAIENKPDYADAYYNRGICNESLNKFQEALDDYNQALSFNNENQNYLQAKNRVSSKIK